MLTRYALLIWLFIIITGCVTNKQSGVENLPDSEVAIFEKTESHNVMFNVRHFIVDNIDGEFYVSGHAMRRLPGIHTLGVLVDYGVCFPGFFQAGCTNRCYSGVAFIAEAGHKYTFDVEKNNDQVYMTVSDNTGKVVTKGACEKCTWGVCGPGHVRSINERIEKESKKLEMQNNLE